MLKRLLAVLLLIPLLDALFLVVVAGFLGWQLTVVVVVLTALLGMLFVRAEGRHTIAKIQRAVAEGTSPADQLIDGAFLLVAGAFLLTPGLVTDSLGFLLVFPPTRYLVREAAKRWVITPYVEERTGGFATGNVYTFGFPNPGESDVGTGSSGTSGDTYQVDSDAYDIDIDDEE